MRPLLVLTIAFAFAACVAPGPPKPPPSPTPTPVAVSAVELARAYRDNQVAANLLYKDRLLVVSGAIDEIVDRGSTLHIGLDGSDFMMVRCYFPDRSSTDRIAALKKGDGVTLAGENIGMDGRLFIDLKNCQIK